MRKKEKKERQTFRSHINRHVIKHVTLKLFTVFLSVQELVLQEACHVI